MWQIKKLNIIVYLLINIIHQQQHQIHHNKAYINKKSKFKNAKEKKRKRTIVIFKIKKSKKENF